MEDTTRKEIADLQRLVRGCELSLTENEAYILRHEQREEITFFTASSNRSNNPAEAKRYTKRYAENYARTLRPLADPGVSIKVIHWEEATARTIASNTKRLRELFSNHGLKERHP